MHNHFSNDTNIIIISLVYDSQLDKYTDVRRYCRANRHDDEDDGVDDAVEGNDHRSVQPLNRS